MNETLHLHFQAADWLHLLLHYLSLSLISLGGAIATVPDMHRYLVDQQHWLTDTQFSASIAIAQAAPGPNILFVALMGWNIGLNAGTVTTGLLAALLTISSMLLPSTIATYMATSWAQRNQHLRSVRAFKQGMAPVVVGLVLATGWILASTPDQPARDWPLWVITAVTMLLVLKTRIHILWLLTAGALLGWFGLV
ncbi:MAG TPA: chromate transporter [Oxalicibacterium sp.]|jgi:chromate transporter|nr:chromate transporter [Oxalicibacterium sp.]